MSNLQSPASVKGEVDRLTRKFFESVSFEADGTPNYPHIHALFIDQGLLIKNVGPTPEISNVEQFIEPRVESVRAGDLTRFHEAELAESTQIFGNIAHRLSTYVKSGTVKGSTFNTRGMISTQFIRTSAGWRISSMAWDDERPGLSLPSEAIPV